MNRMRKAVSVFSNIGVGEAFLDKTDFRVEVACEIERQRCDTYKAIYPKVKDVICGDITAPAIRAEFCKKASGTSLLIATPPCQGFSTLNNKTNKDIKDKDENGKYTGKKKHDPRNSLLQNVISLIRDIMPEYVLIENVPRMLTSIMYLHKSEREMTDEGLKAYENKTSLQIIQEALHETYDIVSGVVNAKDYGTPQNRRRAILLMTKKGEGEWELPKPTSPSPITLRKAIGDLPTLENQEKSDFHRLHYAQKHSARHIDWMRHTPTGEAAWTNAVAKHRPNTIDKITKKPREIKGFTNTYKRMKWNEPAPTLIQGAHMISSSNTVHPGRPYPDGTYSDARTLSILEAMLVMGLPDYWPLPVNLSYKNSINFLGEGFCPHVVEALVNNIGK